MSSPETPAGTLQTDPPLGPSLAPGGRHRSGGVSGPVTQDPVRARVAQVVGGARGVVDGGLPPLLFTLVHAVVGADATRRVALATAIGAAAMTGTVLVLLRLRRREPLRQALGGLAGLAIAIAFAVRSGEARGFFLPGIYVDAVYAIAFLVSVLVGRPLIGTVYGLLSGRRGQWRRDARLRRTVTRATVGWSMVFAVRAGAQAHFYASDQPALLTAAKLLLGWPLTVLAVGLTLAAIGRVTRRA